MTAQRSLIEQERRLWPVRPRPQATSNSAADGADHVDPSKLTVGDWIDQWIAAGAPGWRREKVGQKTLERYEELLRIHVRPTLGARQLQKLQATEIDQLYNKLDSLDDDGDRRIAPMTLHHVHACLIRAYPLQSVKGLFEPILCGRLSEFPPEAKAITAPPLRRRISRRL